MDLHVDSEVGRLRQAILHTFTTYVGLLHDLPRRTRWDLTGMAFNLRNRSFVKEVDSTPKEWKFLLDLAAELKVSKYAGSERPRLTGKNIALIFEKTSTRTRCAFEVAAFDQGAA